MHLHHKHKWQQMLGFEVVWLKDPLKFIEGVSDVGFLNVKILVAAHLKSEL